MKTALPMLVISSNTITIKHCNWLKLNYFNANTKICKRCSSCKINHIHQSKLENGGTTQQVRYHLWKENDLNVSDQQATILTRFQISDFQNLQFGFNSFKCSFSCHEINLHMGWLKTKFTHRLLSDNKIHNIHNLFDNVYCSKLKMFHLA